MTKKSITKKVCLLLASLMAIACFASCGGAGGGNGNGGNSGGGTEQGGGSSSGGSNSGGSNSGGSNSGGSNSGGSGSGSSLVDIDEGSLPTDNRNLSAYDYTKYNVAGTDALNRTFTSTNGKKTDKTRYTGMFFYLTLGNHANHNGIYDVDKITNGETNHSAFAYVNSDETPVGGAHFWGEPIWGYYRSSDPWVIRRQLEMLTLAGLDFICFDVTNAVTYDTTVTEILNAALEYQQQGWDVPKFMFYCNNGTYQKNNIVYKNTARGVIEHLYDTFYTQSKYASLWFAPEGKPLITKQYGDTWDTSVSKEKTLANYFQFKTSQWPTESKKSNAIPWVDFKYPQEVHDGWMNVSPAQHSKTVAMSDVGSNPGRGYDFSRWTGGYWGGYWTNANDSNYVAQGRNYDQQWDTVYNNDSSLNYVFITQWNEWIAGKQATTADSSIGRGNYLMCDNYSEEYSRDLEPSKTDIGDNFYMQTIQNIRSYAYTDPVKYKNQGVQIDISNFDASQWSAVKTVYKDFAGDAIERDYPVLDGSYNLYDNSNRNDIVTTYVCRDNTYVYFRVETKEDITEYTDGDRNWMNILIKTENGGNNSLHGYQYCINYLKNGNKTMVVKRSSTGGWDQAGLGDIYVSGNVMQVRVPLSALGLTATNYYMEFKVCDNVTGKNDINNFYLKGDSAPIGRMSYTFGNKQN